MKLTEQDQRFLARHAGFLSAGPYVGAGLLALLERGSIETSTLTVMAGMMPLMTLLCLTLAAAVVSFGFTA